MHQCVTGGFPTDSAGPAADTRRPTPGANGAVVVRVIHKLRAAEEALTLVRDGHLKPVDMVVIIYLMTSIDNDTGEAVRRWETIAEGCGVERTTVWRSLTRLEDAGLIMVRRRKHDNGTACRGRSKVANGYQLGSLERGVKVAPMQRGTLHGCNVMVSRLLNLPDGSQARQDDQSGFKTEHIDWAAETLWLHQAADYRGMLPGCDSAAVAQRDLDGLRQRCGDRAIAAAIRRAKSYGLHGMPLMDYLGKTYPSRRAARSHGGGP